jgi:hypothetical protein
MSSMVPFSHDGTKGCLLMVRQMKQFIAFMLMSPALLAQTLTLTAPSAAVSPGGTVTMSLALSGSSGLNLGGLEWTFSLPTGITISSEANSYSGKYIFCGAGYSTCLQTGLVPGSTAGVYTLTNTSYVDGNLGTFQVSVGSTVTAGTYSVGLTNLIDTTITGTSPASPPTAGAPLSITVTAAASQCSTSGASTVTSADVVNVINAILGKGSCGLPAAAGACNLNSAEAVLVAALGGACTLQ